MGVAAYQRGTLLNRRLMDVEFEEVYKRMEIAQVRQLVKDAERLAEGIKEMAERFHYFMAAGWYRDARKARLKGWGYRKRRNEIISKLTKLGWRECSGC